MQGRFNKMSESADEKVENTDVYLMESSLLSNDPNQFEEGDSEKDEVTSLPDLEGQSNDSDSGVKNNESSQELGKIAVSTQMIAPLVYIDNAEHENDETNSENVSQFQEGCFNKELESNIARIDSLFMDFTDSELPINPEQSIVQYSNYVTIKPEPMKYESIDVERNGMCVEHEFSYLSTDEFSSGNPLKFSPESKFKHSNRTCIDSKSNDGLTTGGSDVESIISAATCLNNETNSLTSGTIEESVISESSPCNVSANNLHITIQESSVYSKITSTIYGEIHTPFTLKELAEICLWKYNIPILDAQDCRNSTALVRKSMHEVEEPHPLSPREKAELVHYHLPVHIQQKICISDIETWFRNGNWHTSLNALCITQTYDDILFYTSKKPVNLCVYYKSIVMGKHEIPADHPSLEWWKRNPSGEEIFVLENRNKNIWKKKPISIKCQSVTNVQNVNTIAGRNDKENKETVETMSDEQDLHKHSTDNRTGGNTSTSTSSDQIYLLVKSRNLVRKMYYSPESCQVSKILKTRTLKLLRGKNLSKQLMKKMVSVLTDEEKAVLLYHHLPHQQKQKLTLMNVYMGLKIGKNPMLNKAVKVLKTFLMSCLELGISLSQYYNVIVEKKIKVPAKHPVCYWWNRLTNKSLEIKEKPFNKKQFILEVLGLQPEKSALPQKVPLAETGPKTAEVKIIGSNIARMKHDILNGNIGVSEKLPMPPNRTNKWLAENFIISKGMRVLYISQLETKEILNPVLLEWANKASKFCINNCLPSGSGVAILQFVTNSDCFSAKKALSQALIANVIIPSKEQREDMYAQRILSYRLMENESGILVVGLPENRMEEDISALFPGAQTVISNNLWAQLNRPEEYLYIANGVQNLFLVEYDTVESANYALQFQNNLSDMMTVNRLDSFRRMYLHEYWKYVIATKSAQMKDIESERLLLTDKCRTEKCSEVQKELDVLESVIISEGITQEQLREKEILLRERATTLNGCIRCINIDTNRRCKQGLVFPESEDMMTSYTWRIHKLRESRKTLTLSDTELIQSKSMTDPRFRFERESQVSETNNTNKQVYEDKVEESSNQQNSLLLSVYNSKDNELSEDLEQNVNEEIMENVNMYSSVRDVISSKTTKNNPNNMMELERPGTDEPESESQLMSNVPPFPQHDHSKHKEMENITEKKTCVKNEDFQESQSNVHPVIFSPIIHSVMSCAKQSDFHDTFSSPFGANNPAPKQVQSSNGSDLLSTSLTLSQAHNQTTTKNVVSLKATKKEKTAKTFPFSKLCAEKNGVDSNTVLGENVADTSKYSQIVPTNYTFNLHECSEISVKKEPEVFEKQSPNVEHTGSLTEVQVHAVNTHLIQNTEEQIAQINTKPCIDKTSEQSMQSYGHRDYKKLYIGGLPQIPNLQQELKNIFKGTKRIWIISKDNSRFAIADYKTESQCEKDYKSTQGAKLGDQRLTIKYKHKKSGNSNQTLENHLEVCQNKDEGTSNMKNKLNCNVKFQGGNKGNSKTSALNKDKDQFLNREVTKTNSKSNEEVLSNEKSAENLKQIKPEVESGHTGCLTEIKIEAENNDMIQDIEDQIGKLKKKRSLDTENSESMYKKAARYCKRFKYDDLDAPGKESKPNDFDPWDNVISFYTGEEGKRSLDKVNVENMHRKGEPSNTEVIGKSSVQKVISHDDRVRDYTQLYIGRLPKIPNMSKELKEIFKGSNQLKIFNKQDSRFAFAKYKTEGQCKKDYESAKGTVLGNCLLTIDYGYKKSDNSKPSSCKSLETYQNKDNGTSNHIVSVNNNDIADVCSIRNTKIVSLKGLVERTSNSEENGSCNIYDGCDIGNTGTVALHKQGERTPHIKDNGSCNDIFEGCDIGNVEKTAFKGQSDYRQLCKEMTNTKGKEKLLSKVETAEKLKQIKAKMEEIKAKQDFKPQDEEYIMRQERKRKQLEVAILENTENIKLVNAMLTAARRENAMKAKQNKTATLGRSAQDNINLCHAKEPENQRPAQDNTNIQTEVRNIKVELEDGELEESDEEETIGRGLQSEHEVVKEKNFPELHTSNNENESNKQSLISITENATNSIKCRGTSNSVNSEEVIDLTSEHEYPRRKKKIFQAAHVEHEPKDYGKKPIKYMDLLREFRKTRERSSLFEDCQVAWEQTRKSSSLDNNIPRSYEKKSSKDHFQSVSSRTGNKNVTNQRKGSSECWKDINSDKLKSDEKLEQFIKKNERNKKSDLSQIIKKSESISSSNKCLSADDHKCYRSPYSQINNTSVSDNNDETKIKLVTMQEVPVRPVLPEQSTTHQSTVYKSPYDLCSQEETSVSPYTAAAVTSDVLKRMSEDETKVGSAKKKRFSQEPCPPVIHNSQTAETKCLEESDCNTDVQTILKSLQDTLGSKIEELQRVDSSGMLAGTQFHLLLESIGNIKKRYEVESTVEQDNDYGDNHIVHDELTFKAPTVPEVGRSADQLISSQNIHHYPMQYNERDSNLLIEQLDFRTFQNREESVLPGSSNQVPVIDNRCYQPMLNPPVDTISQLNQPPMNPSDLIQFSHQHVDLQVPNVPYFMEPSIQSNLLSSNIPDFNHLPLGKGTFQQEKPNYRTGHKDLKTCLNILRGSISTPPQEDFQMTGLNNVQTQFNQPGYPQLNLDLPTINLPFK